MRDAHAAVLAASLLCCCYVGGPGVSGTGATGSVR